MYLPFVDYYANYTYISTVLCENKDKPKLKCNGKCHLKKSIKKAEADDEKNKNASVKLSVSQEIPNKPVALPIIKTTVIVYKYIEINNKYASPTLDISAPPPQCI